MYKKTNEWYKGDWCYNVRQGQGTLFTKEKNTFTVSFEFNLFLKGDFRDHWPNGNCTILFNNGSHYHGDVVKGVMHGQGKLSQIAEH